MLLLLTVSCAASSERVFLQAGIFPRERGNFGFCAHGKESRKREVLKMYLLVKNGRVEFMFDAEENGGRVVSEAQQAAEFLFDCTCDEEINVNEYELWFLCPTIGDNVTSVSAHFSDRETGKMRSIFSDLVFKSAW
ncbi:MAG: hypothetical protein IKU35_06540 [Bacteroidaceae bacterium]|nr:hypothetical protein [Bacteroidaceae bacterium]